MVIRRRSPQRRVVSRRRNTVVGGKCALPSAVLVVTQFVNYAVLSFLRTEFLLLNITINMYLYSLQLDRCSTPRSGKLRQDAKSGTKIPA